ncbi:MAG: hypothetical protein BRC33_08900 [Cyanobacteria bacterium SW_9_44_58]|jgi:hypothetical protein|nr:MAG: hypothetical protein BRC33_08900 [Cyanobacteria bacterium SW_9_44_58]
MGESKRRREALGEKYGQEKKLIPWLGISKKDGQRFVKWTTRGAWIGIGLLVVYWVTIRLVGPAFGWWQLNN